MRYSPICISKGRQMKEIFNCFYSATWYLAKLLFFTLTALNGEFPTYFWDSNKTELKCKINRPEYRRQHYLKHKMLKSSLMERREKVFKVQLFLPYVSTSSSLMKHVTQAEYHYTNTSIRNMSSPLKVPMDKSLPQPDSFSCKPGPCEGEES